MKNFIGNIFEIGNAKFTFFAQNGTYIAAENIDDKWVYFFQYSDDSIDTAKSVTFCVTKERFYQVLESVNSVDKKLLSSTFWNKFYRIPSVFRNLIIDSFIDEKGD